MKDQILVLGAGASLGARLGLGQNTNDEPLPPIGRGLAAYLVRWLDANDLHRKLRPILDGYHDWSLPSSCTHYTGRRLWARAELREVRKALQGIAASEGGQPDAVEFEKLMDAWSTSGDDQRLLEVTQMLLAYAMTVGYRCAFVESRDRLDDLLASVRPTVVVTLNYDTLIEEALRRANLRFTYPDVAGVGGGDYVSGGEGDLVPVFKLHGSINWLPVSGAAVGANLAMVEEQARARPTSLVPMGPLVSSQSWATYVPPNRSSLFFELEHHSGSVPVAAIYGTGKYVLHNPRHVERHRSACFDRLRAATTASVVAVGIRPVSEEDDPFVWCLLGILGAATGEKVYVSPDRHDGEAFRRRGFRSFTVTLAEFLADHERPEATADPSPP